MTKTEKLCMSISWRLPRKLVYWCALRVMSYGTVGKYGNTCPSDLKCMDALKRWEEGNEGELLPVEAK